MKNLSLSSIKINLSAVCRRHRREPVRMQRIAPETHQKERETDIIIQSEARGGTQITFKICT